MAKTLSDISEAVREIDFCVLSARTADGSIGARPMSNNREVEFSGDSWFFSYDDARTIDDIQRDAGIGLAYQGKPGLIGGVVGKPAFSSPWRARLVWFATRRSSPRIGTSRLTDGFRKGSTRPV